MTKPAALKACYANWKPVPTRGVLQLIFELPLEHTQETMRILGVPTSKDTLWCAIARLAETTGPDTASRAESSLPDAKPMASPEAAPEGQARARTPFNDLSPTAQAGIKCSDPAFQEWLGVIPELRGTPAGAEIAAKHVRSKCKVQSRRQLSEQPESAKLWLGLVTSFDVRGMERK